MSAEIARRDGGLFHVKQSIIDLTAVPSALTASADQVDKLKTYLSLLEKWQAKINLVSNTTLADAWHRHILDSAQLAPFVTTGGERPVVADLGSGAGFPGMVLAILGVGDVHLVESDTRKAAFLNEVRRATGADVTVHAVRIENYEGPMADIIVSRALAPLDKLLGYARDVARPGARAVFLKGRQWQDELTGARAAWHIELEKYPSVADPDGVILDIHEFDTLP